jgi:hypothetical protein
MRLMSVPKRLGIFACSPAYWPGRQLGQTALPKRSEELKPSRGVPTWFMLPNDFIEPLMKSGIIPADKRQLVSALLKKAA